MNEEMRKEFESWWETYCNDRGVNCNLARLINGEYASWPEHNAYVGWQASREAMKPIKLPDMQDFKGVDVSWDGENETVVDVLYEDSYKDAVAEAIKQAGYKVEE